MPPPSILWLIPLSCLILSGCNLEESGVTQQTYFVIEVACPNEQALPASCETYPFERLDVTVSPAAQKVAWKRTQLDGTSVDYTNGSNCTVISGRDFSCSQLMERAGGLHLLDADVSWIETHNSRVDDHLISWMIWEMSDAKSPAKITLAFFNLLSNSVASVVMVTAVVIAGLVAWGWLSTLLERRREAQRRDTYANRLAGKRQD